MNDSLYATGIRPHIDAYLLELSKEQRDYGEYWSASSAGYCMRKVIFDRLGVPPVTEDARKQRIFTAGHIFHEWIQGITKAAGLSISQELELIDEDLMVKGHFDDLVLLDGKLQLVDFKTQNSRAFTYQKDRAISHFHKLQVGTYAYMLRKKSGNLTRERGVSYPNLEDCRVLYISKDDLRLGEKQIVYGPELEKEVVGYWSTINGYWRDKKMPRCTCAEFEGGFMANPKYNDYFYAGEPCSIEYYNKMKSEGKLLRPRND